jgi:hypothetical protein
MNSKWNNAERRRYVRSRKREVGPSFDPQVDLDRWRIRHFIVALANGTFECLAEDFEVFQHKSPLPEVVKVVTEKVFRFLR